MAVMVIILVFIKHWMEFPTWLLWSAIFVWVVKDVILYPFIWRAYDQHNEEVANAMIGNQGFSKERMDPSGYVSVRGELWKAKLEDGSRPIEKGERVSVRQTRGLTLIVKPWDEDWEDS
jgi:membrane-bound ClpP family serine protease